jgi:hypothetical protein
MNIKKNEVLVADNPACSRVLVLALVPASQRALLQLRRVNFFQSLE